MNRVTSAAAVLLLSVSPAARAGVTAEEAKQLGTTLTAIGAERAGNADGTIPAYEGGLTRPPATFAPGSGSRPDPFAGERPLFSIDGKNLDQHADRLTEGVKALLRRYPDFRLDVYPTHRTVAFPPAVTEATIRQATVAHTTNGGLALAAVHAAYPFPIPKNGHEAMWNHLVRFSGVCMTQRMTAYVVESSGRATLSAVSETSGDYPFWDPARADSDIYFRIRIRYQQPARRAGESFMLVDPVNQSERGRRSWQYIPGQRRVRLAPDLSYETPNAATAGSQTFDDALLFNGRLDRYDFTLVGKKEIYVPYNAYRALYQTPANELFGPRFLSPDAVRWELHRVWVVDARLRPGKRHVYARRVLYLDEDSWAALLSDQYDARLQLYRVGMSLMSPSYDLPAPFAEPFLHYDLAAGRYAFNGWIGPQGSVRHGECRSEKEWSPDALAGAGIR